MQKTNTMHARSAVSGRQRGLDLWLRVADLITVTGATVVETETEIETD